MKPTAKLVLMCALGAVLGAESAEAAVTCVENKATGKFEEKANPRTRRVTGECDAQTSMAMASSLDELEDVAKANGTRVIGGVIVTNAAQPFDTAPAKREALAMAGAGDAQRWAPLPVKPAPSGAAAPVAPQSEPVVTAAVPAPAVVKPVGVAMVATELWEMKAGQSLRTVLDAWCERAGYRLVWSVEGGFKAGGDFVSEVEFRQAVKDLFAAIPLDLHLDVEITKNKLVIVSRRGK